MPPGITKASMEFSGIPGHYQFDFDTWHNVQVVLLAGVNMTMITKMRDFRWKENLPDVTEPDHALPITRFVI